jgi:hypothetical protein
VTVTVSPRHRYYRPTVWHRIPTWWYVVAFIVAGIIGIAIIASGGIGLDSGGNNPDPPGTRVTETVTGSPGPTVTVTETADAKPQPTKTIKVEVTPTQSGRPVIKEVPGPTVTKTGAPSTVTVPGPTVTKTGAPASVETVWPQADGKTCIKETLKDGVSHFSAPYPC